MPSIYAQWTCRTCKGTHRVRYPLSTDYVAYAKVTDYWESNGVRVVDSALLMSLKGAERRNRSSKSKKHAIVTNTETSISTVIEVLRTYLNKYYTIEEKTLVVEICNDGE